MPRNERGFARHFLLGNSRLVRIDDAMSFLDQSTALITGASAGLGAEFARQLAPRVSCLVLAARRRERLEALAREVAREGLTVRCFAVDLASETDTERFLAEVRGLGVNVLINNAGLGDHGLMEDGTWERTRAMIEVNVRALTQVTHGLVKGMIANGAGGILNVSSIASLLPLPQMGVYAATKAYVTSFSEALRAELRGTGIRVLALCPGPIDTEFFPLAERPGTTHSPAPPPPSMKVPAPKVVREGLAALEKDRPRLIPGRFVRFVMKATAFAPMFITRFFLNKRGRGFTGH
jgi:uncharacterized protein